MDESTTFQKFHTIRIPAFYLALCLLYTYFQIRKIYLLQLLRDLYQLYFKWKWICGNHHIDPPGVRYTKYIVMIIVFCGICEHTFFEVQRLQTYSNDNLTVVENYNQLILNHWKPIYSSSSTSCVIFTSCLIHVGTTFWLFGGALSIALCRMLATVIKSFCQTIQEIADDRACFYDGLINKESIWKEYVEISTTVRNSNKLVVPLMLSSVLVNGNFIIIQVLN